ncbi:MAG: hypothetical protein J6O41_08110 [Clostridia bacterium]|nr:hypothetical protein [Clostridia bacterium]
MVLTRDYDEIIINNNLLKIKISLYINIFMTAIFCGNERSMFDGGGP